MVAKKAFVDTNVLVYQFDHMNTSRQRSAKKLFGELLEQEKIVISSQVVQEFTNVALKKFKTLLLSSELEQLLADILLPICQHYPSPGFYQRALRLRQTNSLSFYDALIIQAAIDLGCDVLYSEDLQDGQIFGTVTVTNPFKNSP